MRHIFMNNYCIETNQLVSQNHFRTISFNESLETCKLGNFPLKNITQ